MCKILISTRRVCIGNIFGITCIKHIYTCQIVIIIILKSYTSIAWRSDRHDTPIRVIAIIDLIIVTICYGSELGTSIIYKIKLIIARITEVSNI